MSITLISGNKFIRSRLLAGDFDYECTRRDSFQFKRRVTLSANYEFNAIAIVAVTSSVIYTVMMTSSVDDVRVRAPQ